MNDQRHHPSEFHKLLRNHTRRFNKSLNQRMIHNWISLSKLEIPNLENQYIFFNERRVNLKKERKSYFWKEKMLSCKQTYIIYALSLFLNYNKHLKYFHLFSNEIYIIASTILFLVFVKNYKLITSLKISWFK